MSTEALTKTEIKDLTSRLIYLAGLGDERTVEEDHEYLCLCLVHSRLEGWTGKNKDMQTVLQSLQEEYSPEHQIILEITIPEPTEEGLDEEFETLYVLQSYKFAYKQIRKKRKGKVKPEEERKVLYYLEGIAIPLTIGTALTLLSMLPDAVEIKVTGPTPPSPERNLVQEIEDEGGSYFGGGKSNPKKPSPDQNKKKKEDEPTPPPFVPSESEGNDKKKEEEEAAAKKSDEEKAAAAAAEARLAILNDQSKIQQAEAEKEQARKNDNAQKAEPATVAPVPQTQQAQESPVAHKPERPIKFLQDLARKATQAGTAARMRLPQEIKKDVSAALGQVADRYAQQRANPTQVKPVTHKKDEGLADGDR